MYLRTSLLVTVLAVCGCRSPGDGHIESGQHALGQGRFQEAIAHYQEAILDAPRSSDAARALYEIGLIHYFRIRDVAGARATFRKLTAEYPESAAARDGRFMLARIYAEEMGSPDRALVEYEGLLETAGDPDEEKAIRIAMASCRYDAGELLDASAELLRVVDGYRHDASSDGAYLKLAHIYRLLGRNEEAVALLERLLALSQTYEARHAAVLGIAEALEELGRDDDARGYLEQGVREFGDDADARARLDTLRARALREEVARAEAQSPDELERRVRWSRKKKLGPEPSAAVEPPSTGRR